LKEPSSFKNSMTTLILIIAAIVVVAIIIYLLKDKILKNKKGEGSTM